MSRKHNSSKEQMRKSRMKSQQLADALKRQDAASHQGGGGVGGETLAVDACVLRIQVLQSFLSAGIPIQKIDSLRHLLERNNHRLIHHENLAKLLPLVLEEELRLIKEELRQLETAEGR